MIRTLNKPLDWFYQWRQASLDFLQRGDFTALMLSLVIMLSPAISFLVSGWTLDAPTLLLTTCIGVVFNALLARSRYDDLFTLLLSSLIAFITVWVSSALTVREPFVVGLARVLQDLLIWIVDAFTGGINQDARSLTMLIALLFWFLAYNAVWHIFRIDRIWRAILPSAILLGINLILYSGEASLDVYVAAFVMACLLLLARSSLEARQWDWYMNGIRIPRNLRQVIIRAGAMVALVVVAAAWVIPNANLQERLDSFQAFLRQEPIQRLADLFSRLIAPIEADGPATTDYYGGDSLNLGGAIRLGDQPILFISAPQERRYFWRSRVFERYSNGQWSPTATWRVTDGGAPLDIVLSPELLGGERVPIEQQFTIANGGSKLLYAASMPMSFSVGGRVDLTRIDESLGDASPMNVSVARPLRVLERGMSYSATSLMSNATAEQLRGANGADPAWVTNPNAILGTTISPRIIDLAKQIVAESGATTRYDSAKAIETWLRTNIRYAEAIPTPPRDADPIDWFLFELRQGYCTYYATAMVVMLRSLGIPARMVAGFAQGDWDASLGQFVVLERDAHTWVEVYFAGYGWIEFEPTAAQEPLTRQGESQDFVPPPPADAQGVNDASPTPSPSPSPTATSSPTPLPSATPEAPQAPQSDSQPPAEPPTLTPTPTPTPTATPVIVPTVPPPLTPPPPPNNSFLDFLLRTLSVALVLFIGVLVIVVVLFLIYWWWEWRGMGGLSPIARAWARLERYFSLLGWRASSTQTPEEKRQSMVQQLPSAERPISTISRAYSAERYGAPHSAKPQDQQTDEAWQAARQNILRQWLRRLNPFRKD